MTTAQHSSMPPADGSRYSPGSLVRARGREWIVLTGSDASTLRVRPLSGSEDDRTLIHLALEPEPVTDAVFPPPEADQRASHDAGQLLRDALLLSMRRGAGPFRGFGQIAVEPRAYQLVPLLMALKLDPVRLLIADDVGIGKTIEAALIARELLDRGDVERVAVLCPPHLVEQWVGELEGRFNLRPVAVTASSAARLEKDLPSHERIFDAHPHTVVSLDFIKNEKRRDDFLRACPELVIVDEAHACSATGPGRHQRYELLRGLAESPTRHMVLLTATPHSGDEDAFHRLLGLLDRDFLRLGTVTGAEKEALRERLAKHFVQRRRPDIAEWKEKSSLFPTRQTKELTYTLDGPWKQFFDDVLAYCKSVVDAAGSDERRRRLNFWSTLALMRCVASSPAAAAKALKTRTGVDEEAESLQARVMDGSDDALPDDDVEPAVIDDPVLAALVEQAQALVERDDDPKAKLLESHLTELIRDGFSPVVFCRYIATAHDLGRRLAGRFKGVSVGVVTGELTSAEREAAVDELAKAERRILIATDCLSEGVNLQDEHDAVVHYDLSWNPTRHEQREGRVDRFGQKQPIVRATLIFGANNPVDGVVLDVILRKAKKIKDELGVPVPVPAEGVSLTQALLESVILKGPKAASPAPRQLALFASWDDAAARAKESRTVFAQRRLKPEDVLPEWHKTLAAIGGPEHVQRFVGRALARLGSGLDPQRRGFKAPLDGLPEDVRERLLAEGLSGTIALDFAYPPAGRCISVLRSHPLVTVLAETLLERTLGTREASDEPAVLGRVGCWATPAVSVRTTVAVLRLRHQLTAVRAGRTSTLLVEEATGLAWSGSAGALREGDDALALLDPPPVADPPIHVRDRSVLQAIEHLSASGAAIDAFAQRRADALLADHRRVREAADARGKYVVKPLLPADVVGLFVLLPQIG